MSRRHSILELVVQYILEDLGTQFLLTPKLSTTLRTHNYINIMIDDRFSFVKSNTLTSYLERLKKNTAPLQLVFIIDSVNFE